MHMHMFWDYEFQKCISETTVRDSSCTRYFSTTKHLTVPLLNVS